MGKRPKKIEKVLKARGLKKNDCNKSDDAFSGYLKDVFDGYLLELPRDKVDAWRNQIAILGCREWLQECYKQSEPKSWRWFYEVWEQHVCKVFPDLDSQHAAEKLLQEVRDEAEGMDIRDARRIERLAKKLHRSISVISSSPGVSAGCLLTTMGEVLAAGELSKKGASAKRPDTFRRKTIEACEQAILNLLDNGYFERRSELLLAPVSAHQKAGNPDPELGYTKPQPLKYWAEVFNQHPNTITRWFKTGNIKAIKRGRTWAVATSEIPDL